MKKNILGWLFAIAYGLLSMAFLFAQGMRNMGLDTIGQDKVTLSIVVAWLASTITLFVVMEIKD